jgi:hypothetical protein
MANAVVAVAANVDARTKNALAVRNAIAGVIKKNKNKSLLIVPGGFYYCQKPNYLLYSLCCFWGNVFKTTYNDIFRRSATVAQVTVNHLVVGSNPTAGALEFTS